MELCEKGEGMQRYFVKEKRENKLILDHDDIHHIKNVMRNKIGDKVECIYEEQLFICEIINVQEGILEILEKVDENHEMSCQVTIAIGLVKEQKMDVILQKLTELGVSQIIPLKMERSIVKLDVKKIEKKKERWYKICKEAAEQSKRNKVPEILDPISLNELMELDFDKKYICSTGSCQNLKDIYLQGDLKCAKIIFVIGPEGGISSEEEEFLIEKKYIPISFGNRIMRVETAAIYVASIMNFLE